MLLGILVVMAIIPVAFVLSISVVGILLIPFEILLVILTIIAGYFVVACLSGDKILESLKITNKSLIINLPGKPKSIRECLDAVFPAVPYCVDLIEGPFLEVDESVVKAFRPKTK